MPIVNAYLNNAYMILAVGGLMHPRVTINQKQMIAGLISVSLIGKCIEEPILQPLFMVTHQYKSTQPVELNIPTYFKTPIKAEGWQYVNTTYGKFRSPD